MHHHYLYHLYFWSVPYLLSIAESLNLFYFIQSRSEYFTGEIQTGTNAFPCTLCCCRVHIDQARSTRPPMLYSYYFRDHSVVINLLTGTFLFLEGVQGRRSHIPNLRPPDQHRLQVPRVCVSSLFRHLSGAKRSFQPLCGFCTTTK